MIVTVCSMKKFSGDPESPDPFLTSCAIGQSNAIKTQYRYLR